ncbi:alpha/beta hydrolase [Photobacterium jeanii]|uniref:Alpha/beta hydrolase n=1 Tax=Photobacterium jeanii TaxID=858640 RepID=A0A178KBD6_9GAMM|nr:alpha/beta family hydrolase [Photobacterium jeanii]OAN14024.1 alpha/beta hydrolase [Photobacterium jeanii]PST86963.1 alpha/beta hydrolase [Photobacterium jeanii]
MSTNTLPTYLIDGPEADEAKATFLFAHGAGAGMDHEFMTAIAQGVAAHDIHVVRFDFPYMVKRREDGKKRPPDRQPKLLVDFQCHIVAHASDKLVIGGKSMGGRMASLMVSDIADDTPEVASCRDQVKGVACLGFPFHPPGKPENFRGDHLATMQTPTLILQGERDTFGTRAEVEAWQYSEAVQTAFLPDGDHSFKPRKASGFTEQQNRDQVVKQLADFILAAVA